MNVSSMFDQLCELLAEAGARYRVVAHPAEGRSEQVAAVRGTAPGQGAKAMLCALKPQSEGYVLAVLPGNLRLDFRSLGAAFGAKKATLASPEVATQVTGCVVGAIPPFVFSEQVRLVVDPALVEGAAEIAFNAGRLDRSIVLDAADYVRIARPHLARITLPQEGTTIAGAH
jgi:Ala-tRNA(Pro) deacylase